ncbi:MAG: hypothetical protein HWE26_10875 [Alteromonadaceae bacterium]|nr:hypothetical protein [Alteromonadaceae bacterium]
MELGFVLLTHGNQPQSLKLIHTLNTMFQYPKIVIHHDFSKCTFDKDMFSDNVTFVEDFVVTSWGGFSLISAMMKAIKLMLSSDDCPNWVKVLSANDYPIKQAEDIIERFADSNADVFIGYRKLDYNNLEERWKKNYYQRYCGINFVFKSQWLKNGKPIQMPIFKAPFITKHFLPFSSVLPCYIGSQWFTANRKAMRYLLAFYESRNSIVRHFEKVKIPDEAFCQTIFCNASDLVVENNNLRYVDWSEGKPHPKTLNQYDYQNIIDSDALFARKFDLVSSQELYMMIDKTIM